MQNIEKKNNILRVKKVIYFAFFLDEDPRIVYKK